MRANNPNEKVKARNEGLTEQGSFNGQVRLNYDFLDKPLKKKKPTVYAVWNDLFHEDVPDEFRHKAFATMRVADHHIYLILTKRAEEMLKFLSSYERVPLSAHKHIWLGVTAENQEQAAKRIPILLQIPAAVRWVSVEPMLEPINLSHLNHDWQTNALTGRQSDMGRPYYDTGKLDWVACGGESGHGARPLHPDMVWGLMDQCVSVGIPFFFKQWGEWTSDYPNHLPIARWKQTYQHGTVFYRIGKKNAGRLLDGRTWDEMPVGVSMREVIVDNFAGGGVR